MFVATKIVSEPELAGQQEVVPLSATLLNSMPLFRMENLGGRFWISSSNDLSAETIIDLQYEFERNPVLSFMG